MKQKNINPIIKHHPLISDFGFLELEIGKAYSDWIYSQFKTFLGNRIIDVGSGIGIMLQNYLKTGRTVVATDVNADYIKIIKKRYQNIDRLRALQQDITQLNKKKLKQLKKYKLDTAVSVNVLEHIENDKLALSNIWKILSKNGRIVFFVPALPFMYGSIDRGFGHFRRYTKKELINKVENTGFLVEYVHYFNFFGIFWWFLAGKILKKKNLPRGTGALLKLIVPVLQGIESFIKPPIGQSLIVVGKKKMNSV